MVVARALSVGMMIMLNLVDLDSGRLIDRATDVAAAISCPGLRTVSLTGLTCGLILLWVLLVICMTLTIDVIVELK